MKVLSVYFPAETSKMIKKLEYLLVTGKFVATLDVKDEG